jgi:hypothetical protein
MSESCFLASVHSRLDEAHTFWHGCLVGYQEPAQFRANLNAAIQALRNVTFALQKVKHQIPDFDSWYPQEQALMAADPILRWVVNSRNRIVKEGDLETHSRLRGAIIADYFTAADVLGDDLTDPLTAIREKGGEVIEASPSRTLGEVVEAFIERAPKKMVQESVIAVERRWVDEALPDVELLHAMAHAFGFLDELVARTHNAAGLEEPCLGERPASGCFAALGPRQVDGRFGCMVTTRSVRTVLLDLSGDVHEEGTLFYPETQLADPAFRAEGEAKYGIHAVEGTEYPEDPQTVIDLLPYFLYRAKQILLADPDHGWFVFFFRGLQMFPGVHLQAVSREDKYLLAVQVAEHAARNNFDAVIMVSETWIAPMATDEDGHIVHPSDNPERSDALVIHAEDAAGNARYVVLPFDRAADGKVTLEESFEQSARDSNFFAPLRKVWNSPLAE